MTTVEPADDKRTTTAASPEDEVLDTYPDTYLDCVLKSDFVGMQRCADEAIMKLKEKQDCLGIFFEQAIVCARRLKPTIPLPPHIVNLIEAHWQRWCDALLTAAHGLDQEADLLREKAEQMRSFAEKQEVQKRHYCGDQDEGKLATKKRRVAPPSSRSETAFATLPFPPPSLDVSV